MWIHLLILKNKCHPTLSCSCLILSHENETQKTFKQKDSREKWDENEAIKKVLSFYDMKIIYLFTMIFPFYSSTSSLITFIISIEYHWISYSTFLRLIIWSLHLYIIFTLCSSLLFHSCFYRFNRWYLLHFFLLFASEKMK